MALIRDIDGASASLQTMLETLVKMVLDLGIVALAEGIETEEHVDRARVLGATHGQGWLFGRPSATPLAVNGTGSLPAPRSTAATQDRVPAVLRPRREAC